MRYYGCYDNKSRGLRKKTETEDDIPVVVKNEMPSQEWRQIRARLIQKVYEVDSLICPECSGKMRIIAFIEDEPLVKKLLSHLGLWVTNNHDHKQIRTLLIVVRNPDCPKKKPSYRH